MDSQFQYATRKNSWVNIIFFVLTAVGSAGALFVYMPQFGVSLPEILLFAFFVVATGLSITVGYHRLFAHQTFKAHPLIRFFFLFFGAAAFEQPALMWSSQHRNHHRYVDTDKDPYSIKKGFFYAHIGWLVFWKHHLDYSNAKDLQKDPLVMHQNKYYLFWSVGAGIILPVLLGALSGHALSAFLFSVCLRITFVYHATFCINSVCHMFGKATYDVDASAKDHWLVALITYGEGYHNFHHRFPSDYRNGVLWYHWDPSKWLIAFLQRIGLAWDLRRVSAFRILEARLVGDKRRANLSLEKTLMKNASFERALEGLKIQYEGLKKNLVQWEAAAKEYQLLLKYEVDRHSKQLRKNAFMKLQIARDQFKQAYAQWDELIGHHPLDLQSKLLKLAI